MPYHHSAAFTEIGDYQEAKETFVDPINIKNPLFWKFSNDVVVS